MVSLEDLKVLDNNNTKILGACVGLISCISIYTLAKVRRQYKNERKLAAFVITCVIALSNLVAWYLLVSSILESHRPSIQFQTEMNTNQDNLVLNDAIYDLPYTKFDVPGFAFFGGNGGGGGDPDNAMEPTCESMQVSSKSPIEASPAFNLNTEADIPQIRNQLRELSLENDAYKLFFQDAEQESEDYILHNKWFKFCGSATWMSQYQVYFMVNRIIYSKYAERSNPTISVLQAQIFDRDWIEIRDYKFPQSSLVFPTVLPHFIDLGEQEEKVIVGSEDPRVILYERQDSVHQIVQEPIIVFNALRTEIGWARAMHIYRPLSDPHKITRLDIKDKQRSQVEKNWAPFMDTHQNKNKDTINFIYNLNPLRVIQCSMGSGECHLISGPQFNQLDANDNAGKLRGGTNIITLPQHFISTTAATTAATTATANTGKTYWLGIARSHITNCGCVSELYRPHFFIMSRISSRGSAFKLEYVSSLVDFNVNPEPWSMDSGQTTCSDGKSVLVPNSIAYVATGEGEDYMGVTFSEADRTNKLIHLKGVLKHVRLILDREGMIEGEHDEKEENVDLINKVLGQCSTFISDEYCKLAKQLLDW
ncbi:uncharacterized protein LODBEIA_P21810 [Lodderomyces beijingensis]|uniref:Uncharacterized protein n=1 Tax=Lodderomyces beijingensis TaxID=1775926 RepID=A0ABP0ZKN5_9ASCO